MQFETVRRRRDGSIDYDFYHTRALTLRAETMRGFFRSVSAVKRPLILLAALAAAFFMAKPDQFGG